MRQSATMVSIWRRISGKEGLREGEEDQQDDIKAANDLGHSALITGLSPPLTTLSITSAHVLTSLPPSPLHSLLTSPPLHISSIIHPNEYTSPFSASLPSPSSSPPALDVDVESAEGEEGRGDCGGRGEIEDDEDDDCDD